MKIFRKNLFGFISFILLFTGLTFSIFSIYKMYILSLILAGSILFVLQIFYDFKSIDKSDKKVDFQSESPNNEAVN